MIRCFSSILEKATTCVILSRLVPLFDKLKDSSDICVDNILTEISLYVIRDICLYECMYNHMHNILHLKVLKKSIISYLKVGTYT